MSHPSTAVSRLAELQSTSRRQLDDLLDSTPLATVALVRDGHPVALPIGFARIDDEVVIHGSTGSPWLSALAGGAPAAVSVTTLDGVVVARSGFESSFQFRSAVLFGTFEEVDDNLRLSEGQSRGAQGARCRLWGGDAGAEHASAEGARCSEAADSNRIHHRQRATLGQTRPQCCSHQTQSRAA